MKEEEKKQRARNENKEILDMIGEALTKKREKKITDFIKSGSDERTKQHIDSLFNQANYQ